MKNNLHISFPGKKKLYLEVLPFQKLFCTKDYNYTKTIRTGSSYRVRKYSLLHSFCMHISLFTYRILFITHKRTQFIANNHTFPTIIVLAYNEVRSHPKNGINYCTYVYPAFLTLYDVHCC